MKDGRRKGEISVASASSGTDLSRETRARQKGSERGRERERERERERGNKGDESGRARFPSASRYQAEGGHMKLANVPTCPFPTYRVFPAPLQFQNVKVEEREGDRQRTGGEEIRAFREAEARRRIARTPRRGFPLIS